jgi:two-component system response regulator (stage 0 sporulation protein A)
MNNDITVLIADDNIEFGDLLKEYIGQENGLTVAGVARDGIEAIEMIIKTEPDIVILDIIMPNLDGIGVLEKLKLLKLANRPQIVMLTAIGQDTFIQKAISLGADYYIVKPFDIDLLMSRIRQVHDSKKPSFVVRNGEKPSDVEVETENNNSDLEAKVTSIIREIGVPPHIVGYQYIREAVIHILNSKDTYNAVTKVIYPAVAKKFCTTPQKVERAIRNAIEIAWQRGNPDSMDALFGYNISFNKGKPTNSEFIAMIAEKIKMNMKGNK